MTPQPGSPVDFCFPLGKSCLSSGRGGYVKGGTSVLRQLAFRSLLRGGCVSPVGFRGCAFLLQLPREEALHLGGWGVREGPLRGKNQFKS